MKSVLRFPLLFSAVLLLLFSSCQNPSAPEAQQNLQIGSSVQSLKKVTVSEDFEAGSKTAYAAGDVTFSSGVWNLNDALVGTSTSDRKNGSKSIRLRNSGKLTMKFNKTDGAGVVTIKHAKYGTDGNSTWQLWYSTNSGSTWKQTGSTITTSSTSLTTASFTVNVAGTVRFEIRKTDGSANRINIDDFSQQDYSTGEVDTTTSASEHTVLGNPSSATTNVSNYANYLMEKPQYVISYNRDKGEANWVAWHLSSTWLGSAARQDNFRADNTLPSGWYQVQGNSYSGSGYDRGHMCPSADRTSSTTDNSATFLMTNMIPQAANNNQGPWAKFEDYLRTLVTAGNELYIYSGGYGSKGTINNGHVNVPTNTWKIAVVLTNGNNDLSRVTTSTRVISVNMPNDDALISRSADWKSFRVSVDAIEAATGYNFLGKVDPAIQTVIEARVDNQ